MKVGPGCRPGPSLAILPGGDTRNQGDSFLPSSLVQLSIALQGRLCWVCTSTPSFPAALGVVGLRDLQGYITRYICSSRNHTCSSTCLNAQSLPRGRPRNCRGVCRAAGQATRQQHLAHDTIARYFFSGYEFSFYFLIMARWWLYFQVLLITVCY